MAHTRGFDTEVEVPESRTAQLFSVFIAARLIVNLALKSAKSLSLLRFAISFLLAWIPLEGYKQTANLIRLFGNDKWINEAKLDQQLLLAAIWAWIFYNRGFSPISSLRNMLDNVISRQFRFKLWKKYFVHRLSGEPFTGLTESKRKNALEIAESGIQDAGDLWEKFWDVFDPMIQALAASYYLLAASPKYASILIFIIFLDGLSKLVFAFVKIVYINKHAPYRRFLGRLCVQLRDEPAVLSIRGTSTEQVYKNKVDWLYDTIRRDLNLLDFFFWIVKVGFELAIMAAIFFFVYRESIKVLNDLELLPLLVFLLPTVLKAESSLSNLLSRSSRLVDKCYTVSYAILILGTDGEGLGEEKSVTLQKAPEIVFENVLLRRGAAFFENLNFQMQAGNIYLVVGANGAGKSTLLKLMLGLLKPQSGTIKVGSCDTNECRLANVGFLPTETFSGGVPIAELIAAKTSLNSYDEEQVRKSLEKWGMLEPFLNHSDGIYACLGENGIGLSSGQAHKLALAAAFHGNKSLILLDEPTANLDSEGIQVLLKELENRVGVCTVVLVVQSAHREMFTTLAKGTLSVDNGSTAMQNC